MTDPTSKPRSLADLPRRWDAARPSRGKDVDLTSRPSSWLALAVGGVTLVMIAGVVWMWQNGSLSPAPASAEAATSTAKPAHAALEGTLDAARKLMRQGEWTKAETVLRRTSMEFPDVQEVRVALAESLIAQKKLADAYSQYEKALAIGPREAALEFAAGNTASAAGLHDRALEHFGMASAQDPGNAAYALNLGMLERRQGFVEQAKATLLRAAKLDQSSAFAWGTLADIALGENNVNLALQHIRRAREIQPESREWRLIEARARKRKGEPEAALVLLQSMDPSQRVDPPVARLTAECLAMLGRADQAAAALGASASANPTDAQIIFDAAVAFDRAADRARALEFAKRAQMLGHPGGKALVSRLSN